MPEKPKVEVTPELNIEPTDSQEEVVNAVSISGLRKLKQLQDNNDKLLAERQSEFLEESFGYNDFLVEWNKLKDRLEVKGYKIISSIMRMSEPILDGTTIRYEVPNESSKIDLESELPSLLGHLRGHLRNHKINIKIIVNERIEVKKPVTSLEKFQQMNQRNAALDLLRKTFDLNI